MENPGYLWLIVVVFLRNLGYPLLFSWGTPGNAGIPCFLGDPLGSMVVFWGNLGPRVSLIFFLGDPRVSLVFFGGNVGYLSCFLGEILRYPW